MYIDVDILKSLFNVDINNKHLVNYWYTRIKTNIVWNISYFHITMLAFMVIV